MLQRALGVVGFIGMLIVLNVVSYACNWGIIIY